MQMLCLNEHLTVFQVHFGVHVQMDTVHTIQGKNLIFYHKLKSDFHCLTATMSRISCFCSLLAGEKER